MVHKAFKMTFNSRLDDGTQDASPRTAGPTGPRSRIASTWPPWQPVYLARPPAAVEGKAASGGDARSTTTRTPRSMSTRQADLEVLTAALKGGRRTLVMKLRGVTFPEAVASWPASRPLGATTTPEAPGRQPARKAATSPARASLGVALGRCPDAGRGSRRSPLDARGRGRPGVSPRPRTDRGDNPRPAASGGRPES